MDINAAVGGDRGLSAAQIDAALGIRGAESLSERERLALEYADRVSATPVDVPDDFFERLRAAFDERELVELTAIVAHENANAKFNRSLRIESNGFCRLPMPTPEQAAAASKARRA
jgi:alkylhydroperoxidase family enzyme